MHRRTQSTSMQETVSKRMEGNSTMPESPIDQCDMFGVRNGLSARLVPNRADKRHHRANTISNF